MKIRIIKLLAIVIILMIIAILIIGCSSKEYKITIYIMNLTEEPGFSPNWGGEHFDVDDSLWVKTLTTNKTYYASEIIDYSGKSIRFIDSSTDMERFVSADFIEVTQTK